MGGKSIKNEVHAGIEAWSKAPTITNQSTVLTETNRKQVKPVTESKQTGSASKSKTTDNEEELKDEKTKTTNKAEHTHKHVINSGENSGQVRTGQQNVLVRPLKQAMSTNSIAMIESNNERGRNPLNVKRVSSSNDVYGGGSSAVRSRPRMSLSGKRVGGAGGRGGPGKISTGDGVGRRLSADGEGRRESIEGGEGVREEGRKEKTKEHRPSLQSGGIRLPSQRGGRAPPMIQHETVSNKTGLHHPTTGRLHSNIESSPYAVSISRDTRLCKSYGSFFIPRNQFHVSSVQVPNTLPQNLDLHRVLNITQLVHHKGTTTT